MPTIQRLTTQQIEILLDALDHYALQENTGWTPDEESAIADLALALIDPADNALVSEVIVLFSTGATTADTADTSSTEPEATEPTDVEPDPNEEEDLEGEEDTEDDEPEEDEDDEEPDEEEDEAEEPALTEVTLQV